MQLSTKTITVRVDEDTKDQAEVVLKDIGINMTVLFNACLKAVVREKRVPFALVSSEYELKNTIRAKLEKSEAVAENPAERRYTHDEIFIPLRKQFGYDVQN
jgi:DNA-damage-inducible protein J